jgi:hypothetical protein
MQLLFGNFRWIAVLGVIIGALGAYFFWEEQQRIAHIQANGVEAQAALIQILQQTDSKGRASFWAEVSWRDAKGAIRKQDRIPVSGAFARNVSKDGRLLRRETRIKYLPDQPEVRVLLLEDGMHNSTQTPVMLWVSIGIALFSAFGWGHMLRHERRWLAKQAAAKAPA